MSAEECRVCERIERNAERAIERAEDRAAKAAAEVTRLRATLADDAKRAADLLALVEAQRVEEEDEAERLRAALAEIAALHSSEVPVHLGDDYANGKAWGQREAAEMARKALVQP